MESGRSGQCFVRTSICSHRSKTRFKRLNFIVAHVSKTSESLVLNPRSREFHIDN